MALISFHNVSVAFSGPPILAHITLQIERGERVCLLGRNGEGKSTLMHVISGTLTPDSGEIIRQPHLRIGHLPQTVPEDMHGTVMAVVTPTRPDDVAGNGAGQPHIDSILTQLQLDPTAAFEQLSGGLKRRALLARALACDPDLLLLDEPTNHLDIASIVWLETYLLRRAKTLLFVTHDRTLLRALATRIVELDRGRVVEWSCDYDTFVQRKQALLEVESVQWAQFDKKLAQEEAWLRQGIRARRTRNEGRVRALQQLRDIRRARREQPSTAQLYVHEAERSGKLVMEAKAISFGYDTTPIIHHFSTLIMRGDKVGILGANGSGKTTLLRLLVQDLMPQEGAVRLGTRLQVAYFDQLREQLDGQKTVRENVAGDADTITSNGKTRHILSYLQDFLFTPERARTPVRVLSGGERNRLLLARLFVRPSNVLILDEPTNDLDVETLELLEELLLDYAGTVLLVSHDRTFLNNVATSIIALEGNGRVREYVGGYDDWLRLQASTAPSKKPTPAKEPTSRPSVNRSRKLSNKERFELAALPQRIEALEAEQAQLYASLADPTLYRRDGEDVIRLQTQLTTLEHALKEAYARWETLEQLER
jgi:ATP-binding cassette subfamily F protein uup